MSDVDKRNLRAQQAAQKAERDTYSHEVVTDWPACTTCATPIKRNVESGLDWWRVCECPNVRWKCGMSGWVRVKVETSA